MTDEQQFNARQARADAARARKVPEIIAENADAVAGLVADAGRVAVGPLQRAGAGIAPYAKPAAAGVATGLVLLAVGDAYVRSQDRQAARRIAEADARAKHNPPGESWELTTARNRAEATEQRAAFEAKRATERAAFEEQKAREAARLAKAREQRARAAAKRERQREAEAREQRRVLAERKARDAAKIKKYQDREAAWRQPKRRAPAKKANHGRR